MNTLPKSLIIAFLSVSFFISGLNVDLVGEHNDDQAEKNHLTHQKNQLCRKQQNPLTGHQK